MAAQPSDEQDDTYRLIARYRRTVSSVPTMKRLLRVTSLEDAPVPFGIELGQLCPDVLFSLLEDGSGTRFWGKQWLNGRRGLLAATARIECFLATLDHPDLCLAVDVSAHFGLIYPFVDGLFRSSAIVHQWDHHLYFDAHERLAIGRFAATLVDWPGLPPVRVGELTDFQVTRVSGRLVFLDFEPDAAYAAALADAII